MIIFSGLNEDVVCCITVSKDGREGGNKMRLTGRGEGGGV